MKFYKIFSFCGFFLFLTGCQNLNGNYSKIESFDVIMTDIDNIVTKCHYEKGYSINCERLQK